MRFDATPYYHPGAAEYPWSAVIEETIEEARFLEEAGFTTMWFAEHHFAWDGWYRAFPNPILIGAIVGARTARLRIGQNGVNIPDRHPLHVAEDIAVLDQATRGRVDFGVMRGTNGRWSIQFNPNADRRDQQRNYELFAECLEIITKALTEDAFSYQGKYYVVPVPGWLDSNPAYPLRPPHYTPEGELIRLGVTPRPYQKPHPPIWQMADTTESHVFAASRGLGAMCATRSIDGIREAWEAYRAITAGRAGRDVTLGDNLCVMKWCYVAESREEAVAAVRPGLNRLLTRSRLRERFARQAYLRGTEQLTDDDLNAEWFDFLMARDHLWVGTPDDVVEIMAKYVTGLDCRHYGLFVSVPGLTFRQVMRSLALFSERVIPALRKLEPAM